MILISWSLSVLSIYWCCGFPKPRKLGSIILVAGNCIHICRGNNKWPGPSKLQKLDVLLLLAKLSVQSIRWSVTWRIWCVCGASLHYLKVFELLTTFFHLLFHRITWFLLLGTLFSGRALGFCSGYASASSCPERRKAHTEAHSVSPKYSSSL